MHALLLAMHVSTMAQPHCGPPPHTWKQPDYIPVTGKFSEVRLLSVEGPLFLLDRSKPPTGGNVLALVCPDKRVIFRTGITQDELMWIAADLLTQETLK